MLGMARHEHAHEVFRLAIAFLTGNDDFTRILIIKVTDGALDQAALLINKARRTGRQCEIANIFPKPHQIFEVALDFGFRAAGTCCAQDNAHALRYFQLAGNFLEAFAVG